MEVLIPLVIIGVVCGCIGVWFGDQRNRPQAGFWLGLFFGPFGWLLTLLLPTDNSGQATASPRGFGQCPTCGGALAGQYPKCPHCASDVFWAGRVPMKTTQEAADERERQERLAAEREAKRREEEKRWAAEREEERRRWDERKRETLRRCREGSRVVFLAIVSAGGWSVRKVDRVLRGLTRRRREARVRRVALSIRRWLHKANWLLRRWAGRLRSLDEAGKGRCLQLLLAILLMLVVATGALAVGKYQDSCREKEKQELRQQELAQQRQSRWKAANRKARLAVLGYSGHESDVNWESVANQSEPYSYTEKAEAYATYWCRGFARCVVTGECDPAIADFTEAIRLDPDAKDARVYRFRGFARCVMSEWAPAIADLTDAIRLDPNDVRAYAFRSFAYAHQGDTEKAQGDRESAKRLGFTPDDLARLAEVLE